MIATIVMPGLVPGIHGDSKAYAVVRGWPGRARPWRPSEPSVCVWAPVGAASDAQRASVHRVRV